MKGLWVLGFRVPYYVLHGFQRLAPKSAVAGMRSSSCGSLGVMSTCRGESPPVGSEACCKRVLGFTVLGF